MNKKISKSVIIDALKVCNGIHRLNAKTSILIGYGFFIDKLNKEVDTGEFVFLGEDTSEFDGYIDFKTKTLKDNLNGGKIINL